MFLFNNTSREVIANEEDIASSLHSIQLRALKRFLEKVNQRGTILIPLSDGTKKFITLPGSREEYLHTGSGIAEEIYDALVMFTTEQLEGVSNKELIYYMGTYLKLLTNAHWGVTEDEISFRI